MNTLGLMVGLTLDGQRYALRLAQVDRVIRAVEIIPLPQAPAIIAGVINVQGQVVPVVNIRKRFRRPEREIVLSDQIVIARTSRRPVALIVDGTDGVFEFPEHRVVHAEKILPDMEYIEGIVKLEDGMILIHDLDKFLSLEEEKTLDRALSSAATPQHPNNES
ncbi:MAG: chemotaxis protein CheW [Sulfuricaulis sp.]